MWWDTSQWVIDGLRRWGKTMGSSSQVEDGEEVETGG